MSFFTDKKTLLVGAVSLISSVSAVMLTTQANTNSTPFFTQSGNTPTMVVSNQLRQENSYILQGLGRDALVAAVENVGGAVAREFPIINAISAYLTSSQATELASVSGLRMTEDRNVMTMGLGISDALSTVTSITKKFSIDNYITTQTGADKLHEFGITGKGITVAVLDSGTLMGGKKGKGLLRNSYNRPRAFFKYDARQGVRTRLLNDDQNGHGSHIAGIIASSLKSENGKFNGMAPDVFLLSVKAFDASGSGSYSDVLDGLNYIYQNRNRYRIRVVNLSLGADVQSNYWNDPINQAVMRLWDAGVVVITSTGNSGSDYGTVTVPGNNPYVISVGAVTDNFTEFDFSDDRIATFSSKGPTFEGFVKPEVVAFGGHIRSKMNKNLLQKKNFVSDLLGEDYYQISGTSQAAAVVSGTVALMLQHNPFLTPDDVKCRLIDSASKLHDPATGRAYDPLTQGAGLVNAYAAVMSQASGCANVGMDIQADLNGLKHFKGPTMVTADGQLAIKLSNGDVLTHGFDWDGADVQGFDWGDTQAQGFDWGDADALGFDWGDAESLGFDWEVSAQGFDWDVSVLGFDWGDANALGFDWGNMDSQGFDWGGADAQGFDWGSVNSESADSVVGESFDTQSAEELPAEAVETSDELLEIATDGI
ncbi:S8 family peptidase [Aliiglaciecola litoralis]|uniref:Peptidase S8/S53 domain-containing protein n=1 Tax=Aliiglaciecola litoralis TaxID=582857 RepID=A0ABP3WVW2_9ALTE